MLELMEEFSTDHVDELKHILVGVVLMGILFIAKVKFRISRTATNQSGINLYYRFQGSYYLHFKDIAKIETSTCSGIFSDDVDISWHFRLPKSIAIKSVLRLKELGELEHDQVGHCITLKAMIITYYQGCTLARLLKLKFHLEWNRRQILL